MKFAFQIVLGFMALILRVHAAGEALPLFPLKDRPNDRLETEWLKKAVMASRLLDDMETISGWRAEGFARLSLQTSRFAQGNAALRLTSPTVGDRHAAEKGRPYGEAAAVRSFPGEDWRAFNRISVRVFPELPGFKTISLLLVLQNDGSEKSPRMEGREGLNFALLEPNRWNQVVWEIASLPRDRVTGIKVIYRLQGNEPGAATQVIFDLDELELQQVQADHFEGWNVETNRIAYSHSGYSIGAPKIAITQGSSAKTFRVYSALRPPHLMMEGIVEQTRTALGDFQLLNFTAVQQEGDYFIKLGDTRTAAFAISDEPWRESIIKTLNFYHSQRCGFSVTGVHDVCHQDWAAKSDGETRRINGGWHDAGDLSQGLVNTAESVEALAGLAEKLAETDAPLASAALDEAVWGLQWLLKTRFHDGNRVIWATMDLWTDNQPGTFDDTVGSVGKDVPSLFLAASAEARMALLLKTDNTKLAQSALQTAIADYSTAASGHRSDGVEAHAAGVMAALALYKATGEQHYASEAFSMGEVILASQQLELTPWTHPMAGFFYSNPSGRRFLSYNHVGHEQAPIMALCELFKTFPTHTSAMRWYSAVVLHSEFLRSISKATRPYEVLPAGLYDLEATGNSDEKEQIRNGIELSPNIFLRRFPVSGVLRGHFGVLLSQTRALSQAAQLRKSPSLIHLAEKQLEWVLGANPFAQSTMYGEGRRYAPFYSAMSGHIVGALPVGIQHAGNRDQPYWQPSTCYNFKEVWIHPSSRYIGIQTDLAGLPQLAGQVEPNLSGNVDILDLVSKNRYEIKPDPRTGQFFARLPEGEYHLQHSKTARTISLMPGQTAEADLISTLELEASAETNRTGTILIKLKARAEGAQNFRIHASNLQVDQPEKSARFILDLPQTITWSGRLINPRQPWVALIIPNDHPEQRLEVWGYPPGFVPAQLY